MAFLTRIKDFEFRTKSLFYGMEFTNGIRRQLVNALAIIYFISLGHDVVAVTTMFAVSRIIMTLFEFPTGAFADYHSRKKSIMISFSLMAIAFFGIFLFKDFWLIAAFYILQDIAWTFQSGTTTAWVIDSLAYANDRFRLSSLFARFFFFEKTGAILGGLIGLIVVAIDFRFIWLIIAIANVVTLFIIMQYMEERNFKPKGYEVGFIVKTFIQAKESLKYLVHKNNRQLKGLALAVFFGTVAIDSFFIESPLILLQILNIQPNKISGLFAVIGVIVLIAPFIGERSAHKFGFKKPLFIGFIGIFFAIITFAISKSVILSISSLLLLHVLETVFATVHDSAVQHAIPSSSRATLGSAMNIIWAIANAIAAGLVGLGIATIGLINTTIVSGILGLLTAIIYLMSLKE
ncbi:MFS transporter [Candidatus Woesearchaeota archaeon]|nr:MFS transporter [Candidatus Woesearchaeota archaeon]